MAKIPRKTLERFSKSIPKFQKVLQVAKDRDVNESDTVAIVQDMLAELFGYDKYLEITREFSIRGTFCDLAVKVDDKVQFLIEVKAIGLELKDSHLRQAIDYGANHGIQWIVLTNAAQWRVYRIRFEQPIDYDLICSFSFAELRAKDERDQERLFLLSKEGLPKNAREEFHEKIQSVNRFVVGGLILGDPVLSVLRRELRKFANGVMIDLEEVERIVRSEVLKRELIEGDEVSAAQAKINKFYKKQRRTTEKETATPRCEATRAVSETLLRKSDVDPESLQKQ